MFQLAFVIDRKLLIDELGIICRAIDKSTTIPILSNVMVEGLANGTIKLTGTDLEVGLTSIVHPIKLAQAGVTTLPARALLNALKKLAGPHVVFLEQERPPVPEPEPVAHPDGEPPAKSEPSSVACRIAIVCDKATVMLNAMTNECFPVLPQPAWHASLAMKTPDLLRLIARTRYALCKEESRFTLNGCLIESNGTTRMVGTDGHRLAFAELSVRARKDFKAIVPSKALDLIPVIAGKDPKIVAVSVDDAHIYFTIDDRQLIARKLTGNFPDYERVLPKDYPVSVLVPRLAARQLVERAKLFADERSHCIKLQLESGKLTVKASTYEQGDFSESLDANYTGDPRELGFNAEYLLDFLSVDFGEHVEITAGKLEFNENGQPKSEGSWLLKPADPVADKMDYRYVLMPMRI